MLNHLLCFEVNCQVDGVQTVWSAAPPTACPIDAGHALADMQSPTPLAMATNQLHLHDGADRIFRVSVDQNGVLSTQKVSGPDPV